MQAVDNPAPMLETPKPATKPGFNGNFTGILTRFNPENARLMAAKSVEARKLAKDEDDNRPLFESETAKQIACVERVRGIERLISKVMDEMSKASNLSKISTGATALDKLYQTWALLTGHEKPGTRRPAKPKSGHDSITIQPQ